MAATQARPATQLKQAGGRVDFGGVGIANIPPGVAPTDAVNVSQLDAVAGEATITGENGEASVMQPGMVIAASPMSGGLLFALAADDTLNGVGLAQEAINPTFVGPVQIAGTMTLADWTAATGAASLTPRARYFLDPVNPGKVTVTPPTTPGQVLQVIGEALNDQTMEIICSERILL